MFIIYSFKLPQSYINTDKLLVQKAEELKKNNLPPFLNQKEFDDLLSSVQDTDLEVFEDLQEGSNFVLYLCSWKHYYLEMLLKDLIMSAFFNEISRNLTTL